MNFSFEIARDLMVENQLRPNKINNTDIIDLFRNIKKENFLFDYNMNISYSDSEITLDNNRGYLKNLHIAQLIQHAEITESVAFIGMGETFQIWEPRAAKDFLYNAISEASQEFEALRLSQSDEGEQ